jgi:hypothetical protein
MTRVTLVASPYGQDAKIEDGETRTVVRVGQTVDVPSDVANRLASTRALGNEITVENEAVTPVEPAKGPDKPAVPEENAEPAPEAQPTDTAPSAQEA